MMTVAALTISDLFHWSLSLQTALRFTAAICRLRFESIIDRPKVVYHCMSSSFWVVMTNLARDDEPHKIARALRCFPKIPKVPKIPSFQILGILGPKIPNFQESKILGLQILGPQVSRVTDL